MKKIIFTLLLFISSLSSKAQFDEGPFWIVTSPTDSFVTKVSKGFYSNNKITQVSDTNYYWFFSNKVRFVRLSNKFNDNIISSKAITTIDDSGYVKRLSKDSIYKFISSSNINSILGYTPYNGTSNLSGFLTISDLTPYQLISNLQSNLTSSSTKYPSVDAVNTGLATKQNTISLTTTGTSGVATFTSNTLNIPNYTYTPITPTFNNNVSRSLNSNYTISTTQNATTSYSINVTWSLSALVSGSGSAFLEYSTNGGSSWITVNNVGKTLALLTFAGSDDMNLTGSIPANALVRIRTTSSNMTISYTRGQEILN